MPAHRFERSLKSTTFILARSLEGYVDWHDRITQLCNVEAMEQVHIWKSEFQPDFVVAYASADTKLSGLTLQADGAAVRSKQHWYDLKFRCVVTQDLESVTAFEFSLGAEIPKSEWARHLLPVAADGSPD